MNFYFFDDLKSHQSACSPKIGRFYSCSYREMTNESVSARFLDRATTISCGRKHIIPQDIVVAGSIVDNAHKPRLKLIIGFFPAPEE